MKLNAICLIFSGLNFKMFSFYRSTSFFLSDLTPLDPRFGVLVVKYIEMYRNKLSVVILIRITVSNRQRLVNKGIWDRWEAKYLLRNN